MDDNAKKLALRSITYGLFVLTTRDGGHFGAGGVNWLSQASFDPPLVMAAMNADSGSAALIERSQSFAVNTLADDQLDIGKAFFRSTEVADGKINGYSYEDGPVTGSPLLTDTPYWFECEVTDTIARGDHTVFVAEVVNAGVRDESAVPLDLRSTGMNYGG